MSGKCTVWPKLSVTLPGPRRPGVCWHCGGTGEGPEPLVLWREHDANDQPTAVHVPLCRPCGNRIVEPHPRLYSPVSCWAVVPGLMPLCDYCTHQNGGRCACPEAKANGGDGILITPAQSTQSTMVHIFRRGKGARSGWETIYNGPPLACTGRVVTDDSPDTEGPADGSDVATA